MCNGNLNQILEKRLSREKNEESNISYCYYLLYGVISRVIFLIIKRIFSRDNLF